MTKEELLELVRREVRTAILDKRQMAKKEIMREPVYDHNAHRIPIYHKPVLETEEDIDNFIFQKNVWNKNKNY